MTQQSAPAVRDPLGAALDIVGDRWTLLVVRDLLRGHSRFNELRESVVGDRLHRAHGSITPSGGDGRAGAPQLSVRAAP